MILVVYLEATRVWDFFASDTKQFYFSPNQFLGGEVCLELPN